MKNLRISPSMRKFFGSEDKDVDQVSLSAWFPDELSMLSKSFNIDVN